MRALSVLQNPISGPNVTNEDCAKACAGYTYFGTEYSSECYCGYQLNAGSVPASSGCNMACSGNSSEICGGGNRLTVYKSQSVPPPQPVIVGDSTNARYLGCYSEATNSRALTDLQYAVPAANVTVEACMEACSSYRYFGVEYASQCFCGNTIHAGSVLVQGSTPSQTGCNMVCQGNSTEYCGGPNRSNMHMTLNATAKG
jgi:iron transport multicopper oxidase